MYKISVKVCEGRYCYFYAGGKGAHCLLPPCFPARLARLQYCWSAVSLWAKLGSHWGQQGRLAHKRHPLIIMGQHRGLHSCLPARRTLQMRGTAVQLHSLSSRHSSTSRTAWSARYAPGITLELSASVVDISDGLPICAPWLKLALCRTAIRVEALCAGVPEPSSLACVTISN